jgi:hypothetical protein
MGGEKSRENCAANYGEPETGRNHLPIEWVFCLIPGLEWCQAPDAGDNIAGR